MSEKVNILVSGGGTGGHIFPAIAIANGLKDALPNVNILFIGALGKMEMEKVPQAGFPIEGLWISGLQREISLKNLLFPVKMISSLIGASRIIKNFKPDVAIGTGGFASGPLLFVASKKKIPTLILEQNSYPGITNKWLGKSVDVVCTAYKEMEKYFPAEKIVITGSPIRKSIEQSGLTKQEGLNFFGLKKELPTLLIIGGSQGALRVNEVIVKNLEAILSEGINIIWQTGKPSHKFAVEAFEKSNYKEQLKVEEFIYKMEMAYVAADMVLSRAGAIAIAEIVAVKKPAIFVPFPGAAEDHQTKNALSLQQSGAAILIKESEAQDRLMDEIVSLMKNVEARKKMVENLASLQHPDATGRIVKEICGLIEKNKYKK